MVPEFKGLTFPRSTDEAVEQTAGIRSFVNPEVQAEGLVWHSTISGDTFKVSNPGDLV